MTPLQLLPYLNIITAFFAVSITVGGFVAFRNGRQIQLSKFQEAANVAQGAANTALQQRIETLEDKVEDDAKEKAIQKQNLDMIIDTMKQRYGILITIDGDMVTISDATGATTHRKRRPPIKKEEV